MNRKLTLSVAGSMGIALLAVLLFTVSSHPVNDPAATQETLVAMGGPGIQASSGGPSEGIQVHGHWLIEIRDPDGTLVSRREFDNALHPHGKTTLRDLLGRRESTGEWNISLRATNPGDPSPCGDPDGSGPHDDHCRITEVLVQPGFFNTLGVTYPEDKLRLSGTATASQDAGVGSVITELARCGNSTAPSTCLNSSDVVRNAFTSATIPTVNVLSGQLIAITVTFSFS